MTSYEMVMIVLGILTFIMTMISVIVKLLLIIIDKSEYFTEKMTLFHSFDDVITLV